MTSFSAEAGQQPTELPLEWSAEPDPAGGGPAPAGSPPAVPAQAFFHAEDVPVVAIEAMLAIRHDQVHVHGHTAEADAARSLTFFAREMRNLAHAIEEDVQFGHDLARIRRRTAKLGAWAMAFFDRLAIEHD